MQHQRNRILDIFYLVGSALLVCTLAVGASVLAEIYHVNQIWIIVSFISVVFFAGAREAYRKKFRSVRFVMFVCGWLVINAAVFIFVLAFLGWFWLIPISLFEQFLFYMTAYWFFDVPPPSTRWPFQRADSLDRDRSDLP